MSQANTLIQRDAQSRDSEEVQRLVAIALRDLDVAIYLNSTSAEVFRRRAHVLSFVPETTPEAVANCIESIRLDAPTSEIDEPHRLRVRESHNREYAEYAQRLAVQSPAEPRVAAFQAWSAWTNQDYEATLTHSNRLRRTEPESAETHLLVGLAELGQANHKAATIAFERSLEIEPASYWALDGLGRCELASGRTKAAASAFQRAAVAAGNTILARRSLEGLFKTHLATQTLDEAEAALKQVRDLNPVAFPRWLANAKELKNAKPLQQIVAAWRASVKPVMPRHSSPPKLAPLLNGGFELGLAAHWGSAPTERPRTVWWNRGGARSSAFADNSLSHTDRFSLRIRHETTTDNPAETFADTAQLVPVSPDHEYQLSGWARGQDVAPGAVIVTLSDGSQTAAAKLPADGFDWRPFSCRLVSRSPWMIVQVRSQGPAEVWLDDLQLQRVTEQAIPAENAP